jgi:ATP-dependent Clp protease adapter protein ClpS
MLALEAQAVDRATASALPAQRCGRVFRPGEAAYSCYTCGVDPTCIQCLSCFKGADHQGHNIRMIRAAGGGCCDCGDPDSWDVKGFCSTHLQATQLSHRSIQDCKQVLGELFSCTHDTLAAHIKHTFSALADIDQAALLLAAAARADQHSPAYALTLHNDDTHSFQHVTKTLQKALKCTRKTAEAITVRTHVLSASVIAINPNKQLLEAIQTNLGDLDTSIELASKIQAYDENSLCKAINEIIDVCKLSDIFQIMVCSILVSPLGDVSTQLPIALASKDWDINFLDVWMFSSPSYTHSVAEAMKCLSFQLLTHPPFKEEFSVQLLEWLTHLWRIRDEIGRGSETVLDLTVQFFTVPPLVQKLLNLTYPRRNVLEVLLDSFDQNSMELIDQQTKELLSNSFPNSLFQIAHNIGYIFEIPEVSKTSIISSSHAGLYRIWGIEILEKFEGMESQIRVSSGDHVEFESENWQAAFVLTLNLSSISQGFLQPINILAKRELYNGKKEDLDDFAKAISLICFEFMQHMPNPDSFDEEYNFSTIDFNAHKISFHWEQTRFFVKLMSHLSLL